MASQLAEPALEIQHKTLLLAGAGDLAVRTAALMQQQGFRVWGLRRSLADKPTAITWLRGDLCQASSLACLPRQFSHVLYAPAPDARSREAYQAVFRNGLENLLDHLEPSTLERIVFISSTAVYGPSEAWVDENTPAAPQGFNGQVLLDTEHYLHTRLPKKSVVLQPSGLYGPGRTQLLKRLMQGQARLPASAVSRGGTHPGKGWANRFHIEDASRACAHLLTLQDPYPCYIGSDSTPWPTDELYIRLAALLGAPAPQVDMTRHASPGKRLLNSRLLASGFRLKWPETIAGYEALMKQGPV